LERTSRTKGKNNWFFGPDEGRFISTCVGEGMRKAEMGCKQAVDDENREMQW
jgi:hypothetical protein